MRLIVRTVILIVSAVILLGCEDNEENDLFNAEVFFEVNTTSGGPDNTLNGFGHYKTFEKIRLAKDRGVGYGGLLVVGSAELIAGTTFYHLYVYDLACPLERAPNVKITPNANGTATCEECGSKYDMFSGFVKSGPSKTNLQRYYARPNNQSPGIFTIVK